MDGLYERDALAWAEQQADLLRRLAAGERVNADIDWEHVIDEVHDVGRSELHSVERLLERAMEHLLKLHHRPNHPAARHWRVETANFLDRAAKRFAPSMRQRVDLEGAYVRSARSAGGASPKTCPFTLDALLAGDLDTLLAALPHT